MQAKFTDGPQCRNLRNFSTAKILREMAFGESRVSKITKLNLRESLCRKRLNFSHCVYVIDLSAYDE